MPLISVVIPVYNVSVNLLKRCLDSVCGQIDNDVEVVIVDDGSEDENSYAYRELCHGYSDISYYKKENSGPSATRNYGVEKAHGKYVLFVDSDDYITNECLMQAKNTIKQYHPDILFGYVHKDLADIGIRKHQNSTDNPDIFIIENKKDMASLLNHILGYEAEYLVFEQGYISDGPWCRFFKRELFKHVFFDVIPEWNEDTLWNIELLNSCQTAVICKSVWYIYAVRKGSVTQGYRSKCAEEFLYITEREFTVGETLWRGRADKGISYRIWHDLIFLSRAYIFNCRNNNPFTMKYDVLRRSIESDSYQRAINIVDFNFDKRKKYRMIKVFLNFAMRNRLYILVYIIMKLYIGKMK